MFKIGDNIVYPMHGVGIIKDIEEKEILGKKQQYFVIRMLISNMQVMIPTGKILSSSIRPVTDIIALKHIMHIFQHGESDRLMPWKQRFKLNTEKIKTGKIQEGAEVVRDLMRMKKEKALNSSEKRMLNNANEFLISELRLIKGITEKQIKSFC
ncbi:CarD family transcriptional regulator [Sutcliffiella horikoshii]|uniref:CarD family transcriptional regulator n=1 Tax=Sutcliffiella horikoshii TaxID=79883 RepID=UPI001CBDCB56|nr:CarD family transcriptional regulator [Sutcliffiella horikoshii]UAL47762.1 transcription factor YdeB [Sutcliffiella horikoshii]